MVKKQALQIKNLSNHRFVIWQVFWELKERRSGHAEKNFADQMWPAKGFSAWPLCDLTRFSTSVQMYQSFD